MEFKSFGEIKKFSSVNMVITQKVHGSNAQVYIEEFIPQEFQAIPSETVAVDDKYYFVRAGSRTRWIFPESDNYGFAAFVEQNKEAFVRLGPGRHYGEWAGPGINSGEGLSQKTLVLFDWWRYEGVELPPQTTLIPVLYNGPLDAGAVDRAMEDLKVNGSKLCPGFMRPEGVVVTVGGARYKKVFDAEETQWTKSSGVKNAIPKTVIDYNYLCQPIRLEKLLSRDEEYLRGYPKSLPSIVKDYVADLIKEGQISGDEDQVKATTKGASGQIFKFIRTTIDEMPRYEQPT